MNEVLVPPHNDGAQQEMVDHVSLVINGEMFSSDVSQISRFCMPESVTW